MLPYIKAVAPKLVGPGLVKMLGVSPTKNGIQKVTPDPNETNNQHG